MFGYTTVWLVSLTLAGCVLSPEGEEETDPKTSINDIGMSTAELTQEVESLRESQKRLERLSELEGDLMLLLNELAKQPKIDQGPTGYRPELSTETVEPDEFFSSQQQQPLIIPNNTKKKEKQDSDDKTQPDYTQLQTSQSQKTWSNKNLDPLKDIHPENQQSTANKKSPIPPTASGPSNYVLWLGFFVSEQAALAGSRRLERRINFSAYGLKVKVVENANTRVQYHGLVLGPFQTQRQANSFCSALSRNGQFCKVQNIRQSDTSNG